MVLDPIPQPLPVHFFGSRPQPPTSRAWRRALIWGAFTPCRHSFSPYKYPHTPHIFLHPTSHVQANVATAPPYNYVLTPYKYPHNPRPYSLHTYSHTLHILSHPTYSLTPYKPCAGKLGNGAGAWCGALIWGSAPVLCRRAATGSV